MPGTIAGHATGQTDTITRPAAVRIVERRVSTSHLDDPARRADRGGRHPWSDRWLFGSVCPTRLNALPLSSGAPILPVARRAAAGCRDAVAIDGATPDDRRSPARHSWRAAEQERSHCRPSRSPHPWWLDSLAIYSIRTGTSETSTSRSLNGSPRTRHAKSIVSVTGFGPILGAQPLADTMGIRNACSVRPRGWPPTPGSPQSPRLGTSPGKPAPTQALSPPATAVFYMAAFVSITVDGPLMRSTGANAPKATPLPSPHRPGRARPVDVIWALLAINASSNPLENLPQPQPDQPRR